MSFSKLPSGASATVAPFTAHVDDAKLSLFQQLVSLSPIAVPTYENTNAGTTYGITREWLTSAKDAWTKFSWRDCEARFNSFPNFKATIKDGLGHDVDMHFVALFSEKPDALPLVLLHGWPSSPFEFLNMLDLLRNKYSPAELPYHIIVPSLPGYAYSSGPAVEADYTVEAAADAVHNLMTKGLGFTQYVAQGGDLGSFVSRILALKYDECKGIHLNMMAAQPPADMSSLTPEEGAMFQKAGEFMDASYGFALQQGTRPSTVGLALSASPLALLSWIGEKYLAWTDQDPPLDKILELVTLYWMTDTMPRAMYHNRDLNGEAESPKIARISAIMGMAAIKVPFISKPTGYSFFAHEIIPTPKSLAKKSVNLVYFNKHENGGHFAALEQPAALLDDLEAYVKVLQSSASL